MAAQPQHAIPPFLDDYRYLSFRHEPQNGILWYFMAPAPRACFTPELLAELRRFQRQIHALHPKQADMQDVRYLVAGSTIPGAFSLGGDLALFLECITRQDRETLTSYAKACIDVLYPNSVNLDLPVTTVSLVQGSALGGGFEAAISSSVVVAERSAQMGLPEILFNLFPGMGAYSFLSRRLNAAQAERLILSGRTYEARELYEMGLVDVLAEDGDGEEAVYRYVRRQERFRNGMTAVHAIRQLVNPVTRRELMDVAMLWVDRALKLTPRDLRIMERLVRSQTQTGNQAAPKTRAQPRAAGEGSWARTAEVYAEA